MLVLYAFYGVLDLLRNQASGRAAVLFDRRIAGPVHAVVVNFASQRCIKVDGASADARR